MKIIISPAKSLDFENNAPTTIHTQPFFLNKSLKINESLKILSAKELSQLMKISDNLGYLNYERNKKWNIPFSLKNAKQAIYSFTGDVYKGLDVNTLSEGKIPVLQEKLRILSGLYGILKPLDLIQPYRLEMGTKLKVGKFDNLYKFWADELANHLNNEMKEDELLVNLASLEYFKAVPKKALKMPIITPVFKELKGDTYKVVAIYAKKARGLMIRYIIDNNVETIEELKGFNTNGYGFSETLSTNDELVFVR
ncbi:MAG: peroxide stress protein YaaA [Tenacibaculum sp.]|nr:peroxide stress protein YaaA [Tenacibaculum sp.]